MPVYNQYIVKKRLKGLAICGEVNIPYGTICGVQGDFICHNGKTICTVTSQRAYEHFWGYDEDNPEQEIKRQKLAHELYNCAPVDSGDELADAKNPWRQYGELIDTGTRVIWNWDKAVLDYQIDKLEYLLKCIRKGEKPLCLK